MFELREILVTIVAVAVAISVHEFGHAFSAHLLGDDTAKMSGRMTLDPMKHLDPIGLLCMIFFKIGWAKPVPINSSNFKNYKMGSIITSISGPLANVITAIICVFIMKFVKMDSILLIANTTMLYNIFFASFNLLPLPPLDGWGIISQFIPYKYDDVVYKYESMSSIIFLLLVMTGLVGIFTTPISNFLFNIVSIFA